MKFIQSIFLLILVIGSFFFTDGIKDRGLWVFFDVTLFIILLYFLKQKYFEIIHYVFVFLLLFSNLFFVGNEVLMVCFPIPKTNEPVMTFDFMWVMLGSLVLSPILLFIYHKYISPKCNKVAFGSVILFGFSILLRIFM